MSFRILLGRYCLSAVLVAETASLPVLNVGCLQEAVSEESTAHLAIGANLDESGVGFDASTATTTRTGIAKWTVAVMDLGNGAAQAIVTAVDAGGTNVQALSIISDAQGVVELSLNGQAVDPGSPDLLALGTLLGSDADALVTEMRDAQEGYPLAAEALEEETANGDCSSEAWNVVASHLAVVSAAVIVAAGCATVIACVGAYAAYLAAVAWGVSAKKAYERCTAQELAT